MSLAVRRPCVPPWWAGVTLMLASMVVPWAAHAEVARVAGPRAAPLHGHVQTERAQPPGQSVSSAREVAPPADWQDVPPASVVAPLKADAAEPVPSKPDGVRASPPRPAVTEASAHKPGARASASPRATAAADQASGQQVARPHVGVRKPAQVATGRDAAADPTARRGVRTAVADTTASARRHRISQAAGGSKPSRAVLGKAPGKALAGHVAGRGRPPKAVRADGQARVQPKAHLAAKAGAAEVKLARMARPQAQASGPQAVKLASTRPAPGASKARRALSRQAASVAPGQAAHGPGQEPRHEAGRGAVHRASPRAAAAAPARATNRRVAQAPAAAGGKSITRPATKPLGKSAAKSGAKSAVSRDTRHPGGPAASRRHG